jgi:hypothetical protein
MNADKARRLSEKGALKEDEYEAGAMSLQEYYDKIASKSQAGKYSLGERGKIKDSVMATLKADGYKVRCNFDHHSGMYYTVVSWEPEDQSGKRLTMYMGIAIGVLLLLCIGLLIFKSMN